MKIFIDVPLINYSNDLTTFSQIFINKHSFIEEFIFSSSLDDDGENKHVSDFSEDDSDDEYCLGWYLWTSSTH